MLFPKFSVETKFSRYEDSNSDSDDESNDGEPAINSPACGEKLNPAQDYDDDFLNLNDEDEDSLEKLMDKMEEEMGQVDKKSGKGKTLLKKSEPIKARYASNKEIPSEKNSGEKKLEDCNELKVIKRKESGYEEFIRVSRSPEYFNRSPRRRSPSGFSGSSPSNRLIRGRRTPPRRSPYRRSRTPLRKSRSPLRKSRSPVRKSRSPLRISRSPPRTKYSPLFSRGSISPQWKNRSISPSSRSLSPKRRVKRRSVTPRWRSPSPRRRLSRSRSPRRKSISPRALSPRWRRSPTPLKSASPRRIRRSPLRRSISPRRPITLRRNPSPRRKSPLRKSPSPKRRRRSNSPRLGNSPKRRSHSSSPFIKRLSISPRRRRFDSKERLKSPVTNRIPIRSIKKSPPHKSPILLLRDRNSPEKIRNRKESRKTTSSVDSKERR